MSDVLEGSIDERARELLAKALDDGWLYDSADRVRQHGPVEPVIEAALSAINAALTEAKPKAGDGFVLVPVEPTDDMVARGRVAVLALECSGPKWTVRRHYEASGEDVAGIPDYLLDATCPMPKADRATLVYRAMLAAAAKTSGEPSNGK